ncbi:hypothetical protein [Desulfobotulus alkaliphilus]|uniref:hypothetical protein n=1 Tax=Desulfobotulus alkaliphilus TaxID=622671 RepID=UPI001C96D1EA|nr:hypothetical protein [Desulfobotulus alkaliphilus]
MLFDNYIVLIILSHEKIIFFMPCTFFELNDFNSGIFCQDICNIFFITSFLYAYMKEPLFCHGKLFLWLKFKHSEKGVKGTFLQNFLQRPMVKAGKRQAPAGRAAALTDKAALISGQEPT